MKVNKEKFNALVNKDSLEKKIIADREVLQKQEEVKKEDALLSEKIEEYMAWCISLGYVGGMRWRMETKLKEDGFNLAPYYADKIFKALKDNGYMVIEGRNEKYAWVKIEDQSSAIKFLNWSNNHRLLTILAIAFGTIIAFYLYWL